MRRNLAMSPLSQRTYPEMIGDEAATGHQRCACFSARRYLPLPGNIQLGEYKRTGQLHNRTTRRAQGCRTTSHGRFCSILKQNDSARQWGRTSSHRRTTSDGRATSREGVGHRKKQFITQTLFMLRVEGVKNNCSKEVSLTHHPVRRSRPSRSAMVLDTDAAQDGANSTEWTPAHCPRLREARFGSGTLNSETFWEPG